MADKIPVKAIFTAGNTTALGEFNPGDVVPIEFGGTGVDNLTDLKTSIDLSGTNTGDQVLPTTLPASDVYPWAKAATKPSYSFSEITTLPTTISGFGITDSYTKVEIDTYLGNKQNTLTLGSIANNLLANSAVANLSGTNTGDQTSVSGNAGTATKLQTARTIAGVSFDGSANISLTKSNVGLGSVDNTSDASKPVSTAQLTALNLKAPMASPALTGTPTAPTAVAGTNTTQLATTAFTQTAISNLVASSPAALDTLNELATALGNDPNFATTITNALATKAPIASPTFTGTVSGITKAMVGLGSVDNTSDTSKPVSTAQQTALDLKVNLSSATGSALLPVGTTAQRDSSATDGMIRYNSTLGVFEGYYDSKWQSVGGSDRTVTQADLAANVAGNGPVFSARLASDQGVTQITFTKILFNSEEFDTNSNFDTTLHRFTPTVAGYYHINASINWQAGTGGVRLITLYKNGVRYKDGLNTTDSTNISCPLSALVYLNGTTDYIEIYAYCTGPTSLGVVAFDPGTFFQGFLARAA